jgi:hypothetical protein
MPLNGALKFNDGSGIFIIHGPEKINRYTEDFIA